MSARCSPSPARRASSSISSRPAFPNPSAGISARRARSGKCRRFRDGDFTLADSSAIVHYLEAKHPEPALIPADPQAARQDDLVRGVRRHHPVRLRREDVLQPHRRAALPGPPGRPRGGGRGRARRACRRSSIISSAWCPDDGGYLVGDSPDAGRHRGRRPVRQLPPSRACESTPRAIRGTVAYVERILARPSFAPWIERETAIPGSASPHKKSAAPPKGARRMSALATAQVGLLSPSPLSDLLALSFCRAAALVGEVGAAAVVRRARPAAPHARPSRCPSSRRSRRPIRRWRSVPAARALVAGQGRRIRRLTGSGRWSFGPARRSAAGASLADRLAARSLLVRAAAGLAGRSVCCSADLSSVPPD